VLLLFIAAAPPLPQAMFVDFGMAAQYGGVCYLRYDDTNPEAEKQVGGLENRQGSMLRS
jgi:glutamyl/glutaminyl-tRNA synthetase